MDSPKMTYKRYIPSPPLNAYIDYFYYLDGSMPYRREKILPTGWLDLEINFGGAIRVYDASGTKSIATGVESWWVGVWSTYGTVEWPLDVQLCGIHFKPGGAYCFLKFPLFELCNQIVSADTLLGSGATDIREQLYAAPTVQAQFALLEQLLLARLVEPPHGLQAVRYAVAEIARQHGVLSIRALGDDIGFSQNYLVTQLKRMVGIAPKALARLHRLKYVLHSIDPTKPTDWAFVAHQSGYYDQSHFSNDFKAFTGHSPTDYLRLRRQSYAANPERDRLLHVLPTE
jgi:AraC-like DNA-binding protein